MAGFTQSFGNGGSDAWVVRTDENGDSLWAKSYGSEYSESVYSIVLPPDGGIALGGLSGLVGEGRNEFWLLRLTLDGDSLWSRFFRPGYEAHSLIVTNDGGYALAGEVNRIGAGNQDFWLVKVSQEENNSVSNPTTPPNQLSLSSPFPSPFNSTTFVSYSTPFTGPVNATLVDISGRELTSWTGLQAGQGRIVVDGAGLAAGEYWLKLQQNGNSAMTRLVLVR